MKLKFTTTPTRSITFYRGEERLTFDLSALPLGYREYLSSVFPPPVEYVNGQPVEKDDPDYWSLYGYLALARGLEPSGVLETAAPEGKTRSAWEGYARAVREEFQTSCITAGEVAVLIDALHELDKAVRSPEEKRAAGNA